MQDTRMIFPDEFFKTVWAADVESIKVGEIASIYGTSRAAIYRAAKRFKLGPRIAEEEKPQEKEAPFPDDYEGQLLWSKGRWSVLAEIADSHGKTMRQVQGDFHKARAHAK